MLLVTFLAACGSSNDFQVASPGTDGGDNDTSQAGDTIGADTTPGDDTSVGDSAGDGAADVPIVPETGGGDGIVSETIVSDGASCPGTVCSTTGATVCTDTKTDPKNCGACGTVVCHLEVCTAGAPACGPGYKSCSAGSCLGCANTSTDPKNCGGCGTTCSAGQACVAGTCKLVSACTDPLTSCGTSATGLYACVNFKTDFANCGGCGKSCSPGQYCVDGGCIDYKSAPGCTGCPCAVCTGSFGSCCTYAGGTVCADTCPAG